MKTMFVFLACVALSALPEVAKGHENSDDASRDDPRAFRESALELIATEGPDLHASLRARKIDESTRHLPAGLRPPKNPYVSTQPEFVHAIARSSSQGRLSEVGVRAVLYGLYSAEHDLGLYGIEAESMVEADRRETLLREIWAHNARLNRARVHRKDLFLIVVWTDGVSPECWQSVNEHVIKRMNTITSKHADE